MCAIHYISTMLYISNSFLHMCILLYILSQDCKNILRAVENYSKLLISKTEIIDHLLLVSRLICSSVYTLNKYVGSVELSHETSPFKQDFASGFVYVLNTACVFIHKHKKLLFNTLRGPT